MRILVACEFTQIVTKAFRDKGHEAYSCDLLPTEGNPDWHIQGDVLQVLGDGWDMMIAHPPCTYLSYAATRVWNEKGRLWKRIEALIFFGKLWDCDITRICIENPKGCASPIIAKYTQIIQPYHYGARFLKTTCLWLKNLPPLIHVFTDAMNKETTKIAGNWYNKGGKERQQNRSRFWPGIAKAMAEQWG